MEEAFKYAQDLQQCSKIFNDLLKKTCDPEVLAVHMAARVEYLVSQKNEASNEQNAAAAELREANRSAAGDPSAGAKVHNELYSAAQNNRVVIIRLSEASEEAFYSWKCSFEVAMLMTRWDNCKARREMRHSIIGKAALRILEIPINSSILPNAKDALPWQELMAVYEEIFRPRDSRQINILAFQSARQEEGEALRSWAHRVKNLFR